MKLNTHTLFLLFLSNRCFCLTHCALGRLRLTPGFVVSIYIMMHDDGAAPCHYGSISSLAICKGGIRLTAQVGDVICGVLGTTMLKLPRAAERQRFDAVWFGIVSSILTMEEYSQQHPDRPDSIYTFAADGTATQLLNPFHDAADTVQMKADLHGKNVLLFSQVCRFSLNSVTAQPLLKALPTELGRATRTLKLDPAICKVIEELAAMSDTADRSLNYGSTEAKRRATVEKW